MDVQNKDSRDTSISRGCARRGAGCVLVILLIPLIYYGLYFLLRGPLPTDVELIAHRGGPIDGPENTMGTFSKAIQSGVDWIEMDVQRTKDGVLVVIHDETVDRTTNGSGKVGDLTLEEIRALDAGNGERVPTFEEVIAVAREAEVGLLPEAKSPHLYPGIEADIVDALIDGEYVEGTVVQSFAHDVLETIQSINPDLRICPLYGLWGMNLSDPQPKQADMLCPMAEMILLNPWMIKQAHEEGRDVFVWFGVSKHPILMRFILATGADGLMVDDPSALKEVLGR